MSDLQRYPFVFDLQLERYRHFQLHVLNSENFSISLQYKAVCHFYIEKSLFNILA